MAATNLNGDLRREQAEYELKLTASALNNPAPVVEKCGGFITPDMFVDTALGEYWERVCQEPTIENSVGAAFSLGVSEKLYGADLSMENQIFGFAEFANKIAQLSYIRKSVLSMASVVQAATARDANKIKEELAAAADIKLTTEESERYTGEDMQAELMATAKAPSRMIKTRIQAYDNLVGGFYPGEATILAARPGMGKTALALNIARNVAFSRKRVLFLSLEMSRLALWTRMACGAADVNSERLRDGTLTDAELNRLDVKGKELSKKLGGFLVVEDNTFTLNGIYQSIISVNPDIVIIDQLSDIFWHDPSAKQFEWYGPAFLFLRNRVAKQLDIPTCVIHQINRGSTERPDKRPTKEDLRGSGEFEQRTDVAVGLHRDDIYNGRNVENEKVEVEFIPLKNRPGGVHAIKTAVYDLIRQNFE